MDPSHDKFLWFHSYRFLFFFVAVFTVYWSLPWLLTRCLPAKWAAHGDRLRKVWLLLCSCFFYATWKPLFLLLILASASVDYFVALRLEHVQDPPWRRFLLTLSVCTNLAILFFFKYCDFFLASTADALAALGFTVHLPTLRLILPLGISFYTFEAISYIVDVYHRKIPALRNPLDYALYIMFFPHLIAGPIVRPREFLPQLRQSKRWNWDRLQLGAQWFLMGLFKKAVIADHLAQAADPVFKDPAAFSSGAVWLAVLAYAVQIYCDFSGYTDMAIGVAHTLGYKLPNNFHLPYFSANITEFWRRWHISLSSWLRDYLYIPLGGNRHGTWQTYRNLILTMLLGGLWHGANWTFVAWGLLHGVWLAVHRVTSGAKPQAAGVDYTAPFKVVGTFLGVCVGWVFFRAQSFGDAWTVLTRMVVPSEGHALPVEVALGAQALLVLVLACHLFATFVDMKKTERWLPAPALGAAMAAALLVAQLLMPESGAGFIYFQF